MSMEREEISTQNLEFGAESGPIGSRTSQVTEDYSQALKRNGVCPAGFQNFQESVNLVFHLFSFGMGILYCYRMPVPSL